MVIDTGNPAGWLIHLARQATTLKIIFLYTSSDSSNRLSITNWWELTTTSIVTAIITFNESHPCNTYMNLSCVQDGRTSSSRTSNSVHKHPINTL